MASGLTAQRLRPLLWLVLALPGAAIAGRWLLTPDRYGYGHAIAESGDWAAWLLLATLAVTPVRLLAGSGRTSRWLLAWRRDLGVASFAYAAGHTTIYLADQPLATALRDGTEPALLSGWIALALFAPLAITSSDRAVRAMKNRWKRLHRLVHPAAVLAFVHWALSAFDPAEAYLHIAILAAIEAARIGLQRRQRVT